MKASLVFVLLACILGAFAGTTNYYISASSGNNSWTGESEDEPVQTLVQALNLAINNSDTSVVFNLFPGNYSGNANLGLNYNGFDDVEFVAYTSTNVSETTVVIDCSKSAASNGFNFNGTAEISFNGENATDDGNAYFLIYACTAAAYVVNTTSVTATFENVAISDVSYGIKGDATSTFRYIGFDDSSIAATNLAVSAVGDDNEDSQVEIKDTVMFGGGINVSGFNSGILGQLNISSAPQTKSSIAFANVVGGTWDFDDIDVTDVACSSKSPFTFVNATLNVITSTFTRCTNDKDGGCFSLTDTAVLVNGTTFDSCSSGGNGGAVYQSGGGLSEWEYVNFTSCSAFGFGGAIFLDDVPQTYFSNVAFTDDTAVTAGNAIACCANSTCTSNTTIVVYNGTLTVTPVTASDITCKMGNTSNASGYSSEFTTASPVMDSSTAGTPWWVWLILGLIVLAIIIAVIAGIGYFVYQKRRAGYSTVE